MISVTVRWTNPRSTDLGKSELSTVKCALYSRRGGFQRVLQQGLDATAQLDDNDSQRFFSAVLILPGQAATRAKAMERQ